MSCLVQSRMVSIIIIVVLFDYNTNIIKRIDIKKYLALKI